tara:strand:+ start:216 stop:1058 length:843 start_codon:yes stop_codon:yes gene_type:complete
MGINVLSLFDGLSCAQIALDKLDIDVDNYYASEVDEKCISITNKNYPNTIQLGDVITLNCKELNPIHLLIGGSPCQGFSLAGNQLNFDDPRSALFFEFVRILKECEPTYFLLENVRMKQEVADAISHILGVVPVEINSSLVSGQNRRRYYWTNIPNITQPPDMNINGRDVFEDTSYEIATVRKGKNGGPRQITSPNGLKLPCLTASYWKGINADGRPGKSKYFGDYFVGGIEMLLPIECERLQNIPDDYTAGVAKTHRYKMIGNAFTVNVIKHILKEMKL